MLSSHEGAMVDAAAEATAPPAGCKTLCQHPGCGRAIVVSRSYAGAAVWVHDEPFDGPDHPATPVERHRQASRLRPVTVTDIMLMARRLGQAEQDALIAMSLAGQDSARYQVASRARSRRYAALRRLAEALDRQGGGAR